MSEVTTSENILAVNLTVGQLREIMRQEIKEAVGRRTDDNLLTAKQLAEQLKVPRSWVYEKSRQGKIPTHRMGHYLRFRLQEVVDGQTKN
jgi:excisionase family DNA binding protein